MSYKIGSDMGRFKEIVRNKVKHNLGKYVSRENLIGQQGGKPIQIPLDYIDLPRFSFGGGNGGTGSGDGNEGDPMDGSGKPGKGKGKAGNDKGEHEFMAEFTVEELAQMLGEELQLPDVDEKGKGKIVSTKNLYNGINNVGAEGLRHFKRTFKQALIRQVSTGTYNPKDPKIIPIRADKRYRTATPITEPMINTVVIYMMDVSGSMGDEQKHIVKSEVFWIDAWLKSQYKNIETRFIVHDTEASEVDREQFFSIREAGGTNISPAYEFCNHLMETEYPFSEWNVYPFHFSDGDNWGDADNAKAADILRNKIMPKCNVFSYGQVGESGSGEFGTYLAKHFTAEDNLTLSNIRNKDEILASIKTFLGKGK